FGLATIPDGFVTRVLAEAGGSPFFLEEMVRSLVERGAVFVEGDAWRTLTAIGDLEIPETVAGALQRRLAMIGDADQHRLLRVLAAHKKPLPASLLGRIAGITSDEAERALHELAARDLVVAVTGGSSYRTAHDHVRTTVYADLGSEAPDLHRQIARALESVATRDEPLLSELAHHYWLAQESAPAFKYALLPGQAARPVLATGEAIV